jgi:hypothetical protein
LVDLLGIKYNKKKNTFLKVVITSYEVIKHFDNKLDWFYVFIEKNFYLICILQIHFLNQKLF